MIFKAKNNSEQKNFNKYYIKLRPYLKKTRLNILKKKDKESEESSY